MSVIFTDGFDKYGPSGISTNNILASLLVQGEWTTVSGGYLSIIGGLSSTGYALQIGNNNTSNSNIYKTLPAFYPRLIGGFRFSASLISGTGFILTDGGAAQCSISIDTTGTISVRSSGLNSTVLRTSLTSISAYSTHYLEFDITISSSGSYQVWLDGLSILNGIGDTQGGTASNHVNGLSFSANAAWPYNSTLIIDDFYLFDSNGTRNAVLLTNPRIETQFPIADVQTQFSNSASIIGNAFSITSNTSAPGANTLFLRQYSSATGVSLNSISCVPQTTASAKFKAVVYSDTSGHPSSLLSVGNEIYGILAGVTLTSTLATPQTLVANTPYWIGFITDSTISLAEQDATISGVKLSNSYSEGAPPTVSSVATGLPSWQIWGNCTGATANWVSLSNNPSPGNLSYISSPTVGINDLYSFAPLSSNPTYIYAVAVKGNVTRTDTGLRTVDMCMKSGSSLSLGSNSNVTPPTSFSWVDSYYEVDPNTGNAWTITGLNAATAGPKIES